MKRRSTNVSGPSKRPRSTKTGYPAPTTRRLSAIPRPVAFTKGSALPLRLQNQLTYKAVHSVGAIGLAISTNGLFLPYAGAHQPLYFDQLTALYNHYVVMKSTIKVTPVASTTANFKSGILALFVEDNTTATTGGVERKGAVTKPFNLSVENGQAVYSSWDAQKVFGGNVVDNQGVQGTITANPTDQNYFLVEVHNDDGAVIDTVDVWIEITYDVIFSELKSVNQS